jgi:hypothetical protein
LHTLGTTLSWVAGLTLMVSSFTGWYASEAPTEPPIAVLGWDTGTLGRLVFFCGAALVLLSFLRTAGVVLPRGIPESLLVLGLGALATIFVLIRLISIPENLVETTQRGIGLWISLAAGVAVIVAGFLQAADEADRR